jgi:hypothetical protein
MTVSLLVAILGLIAAGVAVLSLIPAAGVAAGVFWPATILAACLLLLAAVLAGRVNL